MEPAVVAVSSEHRLVPRCWYVKYVGLVGRDLAHRGVDVVGVAIACFRQLGAGDYEVRDQCLIFLGLCWRRAEADGSFEVLVEGSYCLSGVRFVRCPGISLGIPEQAFHDLACFMPSSGDVAGLLSRTAVSVSAARCELVVPGGVAYDLGELLAQPQECLRAVIGRVSHAVREIDLLARELSGPATVFGMSSRAVRMSPLPEPPKM
ncbi:hypothetical protein ABZ746_29270 [Streptomyces sp. NPDC020096]